MRLPLDFRRFWISYARGMKERTYDHMSLDFACGIRNFIPGS